MKNILGISCFYHDSAAAITSGGTIVAAAQEERFTRRKHDAGFPAHAIRFCLEEAGLTLNELDAIVFYDKPLLKFERLLETYFAFAPKGLLSFLKAIPIWLHEKLFLKKQIYDGLKDVGPYNKTKIKLLFSEHHLSHAASAFYASPYRNAAILTIDGVGEWSTASIGIGNGNKISIIKELHFPHSVGLLYSAFTYFLGFRVNSGEYKLMGLAPYGHAHAPQTIGFIETIKSKLVNIKDDGSIWLDQHYFNYATGLHMVKQGKWIDLFGFPPRTEGSAIEQHHCNLALAIQKVTEEIVLKMANEARKITGEQNLVMAGGVALNCVANGKLLREKIFDNIYIQPAAGDAGGALGAALAVNFMYFDEERSTDGIHDLMAGTYLGPEYSEKEISAMNRKVRSVYTHFINFNELTSFIAGRLASGDIVGWFQGRMEFGPRALGNRSILADARDSGMQKKLNLKIKYREGFRPFAPSVLAEDTTQYFDLDSESPYMLFVAPVTDNHRKELPVNYNELTYTDRLYCTRSDIPAVTHLDFSARIQTVHKETNSRFWDLINSFNQQTGYSLLINTSFNVRGEPIVCTPLDAYACFMSTDMDILVIGDFVYMKTEQPDWQNTEKWKKQFVID